MQIVWKNVPETEVPTIAKLPRCIVAIRDGEAIRLSWDAW